MTFIFALVGAVILIPWTILVLTSYLIILMARLLETSFSLLAVVGAAAVARTSVPRALGDEMRRRGWTPL